MMIVLVLQYTKIVLYNNHLAGFQFFKFLRYVISVAPFFHNIFPSECQVTQQDYHCVKTTHSKEPTAQHIQKEPTASACENTEISCQTTESKIMFA